MHTQHYTIILGYTYVINVVSCPSTLFNFCDFCAKINYLGRFNIDQQSCIEKRPHKNSWFNLIIKEQHMCNIMNVNWRLGCMLILVIYVVSPLVCTEFEFDYSDNYDQNTEEADTNQFSTKGKLSFGV